MWADSRAFLSAICHNTTRSGAVDDDDNDDESKDDAKCSVVDFDAPGQPRRRRVGLVLTTKKKRGRINSAGGATSKGNISVLNHMYILSCRGFQQTRFSSETTLDVRGQRDCTKIFTSCMIIENPHIVVSCKKNYFHELLGSKIHDYAYMGMHEILWL